MNPVPFPQANRNLTAPAGMTREECGDLPTFTDGRHCISLWGLSWRERLRVLFTGRVWLWVWSGHTQPPVALSAESPFAPLRKGSGERPSTPRVR